MNPIEFSFQYVAAFSAASSALSVGFCVAHTGILIPQLQNDPEMRISLKQGSWMGKNIVDIWSFPVGINVGLFFSDNLGSCQCDGGIDGRSGSG